MGTSIQVAGALAVLLGFALAQLRILDARSYSYLALNLAGASVLAVDALIGREWGFFVLESIWAVVSSAGLTARLVGRDAPPGTERIPERAAAKLARDGEPGANPGRRHPGRRRGTRRRAVDDADLYA